MRIHVAIVVALVLCAGLGHVSPLAAQDPYRKENGTLELEVLLEKLRTGSQDVLVARLHADALTVRSDGVAGLPDPTIGLSVFPYPIGTARGLQQAQIRLEQRLPFPGKRRLARSLAELDAGVAALDVRTVELNLALAVKQTFYDLFRVQQIDSLVAAFQRTLRDFEEVASTRYEVGSGSQQAIIKAQLERNRLDIRREQLAEERASAFEILGRLVNDPELAVSEPGIRITVPELPERVTASLDRALQNRPEIAVLESENKMADQQIALSRKAYLPDFSLNMTYFNINNTGVPPGADGKDALAFGVGIQLPLWNGKRRADLEEARLRKRQVAVRQEVIAEDIGSEIRDLVQRRDRQSRRLRLFDEVLLPQAQIALDATLSSYATGRTSFLDLLDTERTLFDLHIDRATTRAMYMKTTAALERALGITTR